MSNARSTLLALKVPASLSAQRHRYRAVCGWQIAWVGVGKLSFEIFVLVYGFYAACQTEVMCVLLSLRGQKAHVADTVRFASLSVRASLRRSSCCRSPVVVCIAALPYVVKSVDKLV